MRLSCNEILDLSHQEIFSLSTRSPVVGAMFLVSLVRGGMVVEWRSRRGERKLGA
jgi:hypothetical protein